MSDEREHHGFMTHEEMAQHFPGKKRLELVVLREHDGDHMWQRTPDGWYRLSNEVRSAE